MNLLMRNKEPVNFPRELLHISTSGYSALHIACLENDDDLVRKLIHFYDVNVNIVAEDGTQPIHVAGLRGYDNIVKILVAAKANVDAEFGKDIFSKFIPHEKWCDEFGNKITLITFAILYQSFDLVNVLVNHSNLKIKSCKNKTLLMHALQHDNLWIANLVASQLKDREFVNARDNDGFSTIHYLFHPRTYGYYFFSLEKEFIQNEIKKGEILNYLIDYGADIHTMANGDSNSLLLNMAAYQDSLSIIKRLLPRCTSINESKALYYVLFPCPGKYDFYLALSLPHAMKYIILKQHCICVVYIALDLINKLSFGLSVPEEEKKLLNEIVNGQHESYKFVGKLVTKYKQTVIHGFLKDNVIKYGDKSISHYEFISKCLNNKKLKLLVRDKTLMEAFRKTDFSLKFDFYEWFKIVLTIRIKKAHKRNVLLEKLKKVSLLYQAIPLPYECILDMIEYLSNDDLEIFINTFFH